MAASPRTSRCRRAGSHLGEVRWTTEVVPPPRASLIGFPLSQIKAACRRKGFAASDFDFLIAATAKAHGLILATLNVRHFNGMEGLATEDWSRG